MFNVGQVLKHEDVSVPYTGNVAEEAVRFNWVKPFSTGQWIYLAPMARLIRALHEALRRHIVPAVGYEEWIFPRLQHTASLESFGWLAVPNLPLELFDVTPHRLEERPLEARMLDPLQCTSFYHYFSQGKISDDLLPLKIFEVLGGWTYRNEKPERFNHGFHTGLEFCGAELVFLGSPAEVKDIRWQTLRHMTELLNRLGMNWRLVVGTSCCHKHSEKYSHYLDEAISIDEIPTIDIEGWIPATGEWLELGGGDIAHDRLVNGFGLQTESNADIWSGCQGLGFGRMAYVFLSQFGFDTAQWPTTMSELLP